VAHLHGYLAKMRWSGNYLAGLLRPFYHNSAPVKKKILWVLDCDFGDDYAGGFVYSEYCFSKKQFDKFKYCPSLGYRAFDRI
jgi:hypothetical protein